MNFLSRLVDIARWFLLALLVYAPWAYGSTRPWAKDLLSWMLIALGAIFFLGLVGCQRWPRVPTAVKALTGIILFVGWWMALNAYQVFHAETFTFTPAPQILPDLPGAVDRGWVVEAMRMQTGLFAALWVVCDLSSHTVWQKRLVATIALTGISIVILGLLQRVTGAVDILWATPASQPGSTFFATYRYHGNAGAYLNQVIPFIALSIIWTFRNQGSQFGKGFWVAAGLLTAVSTVVNISRAAMAISVLLMMVLATWQYWAWLVRSERRSIIIWVLPVIAVATVLLLAWAFGLDRTIHQWSKGGNQDLLENQRLVVYQVIWDKMVPGVAWWGFGPGTFQIVFPFYTDEVASKIPGIWKYAHEDYLQTLVEWGWAGTALWGLLIFGGLFLGLWRLGRYQRRLSFKTRSLLFVSILAVGGVLLHSVGDFPLQIASLRLYAIVALGLCWTLGQMPYYRRADVVGLGYDRLGSEGNERKLSRVDC